MTITDILEQAKQLTVQERKELTKLLIDMIDETPVQALSDESEKHWGKSIVQLLDEIGPIELKYPEIEDPVEWVKHIRAECEEQLKPYWDGDA